MISRPSSSSHCSPVSAKPYCAARAVEASLSGLMLTRTVVTIGSCAAPEQGLKRGPGVAAPPVRGIDGVADLDHPGLVGRAVIAGPAHGHLLLLVPDDSGDPIRAGRVPFCLLAAPAPGPAPLVIGEV